MVSSLANPERSVTSIDGTEWHLAVVRGNKWRGVDWERHPVFGWNPFGRSSIHAALVEGLLFDAVLWLAYKVQRRNDWRVVLRPSPRVPLTAAVLDERYQGRQVAAQRAEDLLGTLRTEGLPQQ